MAFGDYTLPWKRPLVWFCLEPVVTQKRAADLRISQCQLPSHRPDESVWEEFSTKKSSIHMYISPCAVCRAATISQFSGQGSSQQSGKSWLNSQKRHRQARRASELNYTAGHGTKRRRKEAVAMTTIGTRHSSRLVSRARLWRFGPRLSSFCNGGTMWTVLFETVPG